ncbi:MAG: MATE family efflux transporter [Bacteroidetes bacterium]|nr:MATE family efflux transporter [Bacteroidota bacterium]
MKVNSSYKDIWSISYPIILGSLATTVLNITNTAFLARVGEVELGAMAIAGVFYFVLVMIGIALGTGAQILISRRAGEGDTNEIGKLFDHTFLLLSGVAIIMFLFSVLIAPDFFSLLLKSPNVLKACNDYIGIRSYGILITLVSITFRSFFIGISHTRIITYSAIIMMVANVILDYLLIFGKYGFPEMGIKGAAWASVIAEFIAFAYLFLYSLVKHEFHHFRLFRFTELTHSRFSSIFHLSSPVILQNTLSMGAWFLFFVFIERMGEHELAISNIIRATYMILMTPIWGYASATNSMVSNLIGQGKIEEVKQLVKRIINLSLITSGLLFAITFISPQWLLRITTSDQVLIADSMGTYYIIIGAMLLFSVSVILLSAVSGSGNTKSAMVIEFFNILVYMIYVYFCAIVINASIEVVWFSEIIYWVLMGVFSAMYLKFSKWKPVEI